jgi:hypothetical protein
MVKRYYDDVERAMYAKRLKKARIDIIKRHLKEGCKICKQRYGKYKNLWADDEAA